MCQRAQIFLLLIRQKRERQAIHRKERLHHHPQIDHRLFVIPCDTSFLDVSQAGHGILDDATVRAGYYYADH